MFQLLLTNAHWTSSPLSRKNKKRRGKEDEDEEEEEEEEEITNKSYQLTSRIKSLEQQDS